MSLDFNFKIISMLPKTVHLQQLEKFYSKVEEISTRLEEIKDLEDFDREAYKLSLQYYKLSKIWLDLDTLIETRIRPETDCVGEN